MKILTTSADEQDFLLNQKAALGLAELRDRSRSRPSSRVSS